MKSTLSRRNALTAGSGLALMGATGAVTRAAHAADFDATDPVSVLRTVSRMRGSLNDGRIAMGWLKGQRYGVVDGEITPLMGMVTGTFARYRILEGGLLQNHSFELAFYTDFNTGEVLEELTIPYTGKTVKVPRLLLGPAKSVTRPVFHEIIEMGGDEETLDEESESAMRPSGSSTFERWMGPVTNKDGHVWITQASSATLTPADPNAPKVVYSESVTSMGSDKDVMSDMPSIPATLSYTGITTWRPWMQMGDHPGHTTSSGIGGKAFDIDDLPDDYRAMSEKYYPEAFGDPAAILDKMEE